MDLDRLLSHGHFPKAATISTRLILDAAEQLGVEWQQIENTPVFCLEYQGHQEYLIWQVSPHTSFFHFYVTQHKQIAKHFLRRNGVSVPRGKLLDVDDSREEWLAVFEQLTKPLVVKPVMGEQGIAVSVNVRTVEEYLWAVEQSMSYEKSLMSGVIVEEMFQGKEYRVVVCDGEVIAITHRIPANVIGDGVQTIEQLIAEKNRGELRRPGKYSPFWEIKVDQITERKLTEQGLTLQSIPPAGQRVFLRYNSNLSTGGDSVDVTDQAHPSVKEIAQQALASIPGMNWAGLDLMTTDITAQQTEDTYVIIELNISPGISMQEIPAEGESRPAGTAFVRSLFPELR